MALHKQKHKKNIAKVEDAKTQKSQKELEHTQGFGEAHTQSRRPLFPLSCLAAPKWWGTRKREGSRRFWTNTA